MNFERHLEYLESLWPGCWIPGANTIASCSALAIEDLPSDYLGFMAYKVNTQWTIGDMLGKFSGESYGANTRPIYDEDCMAAYNCLGKGICGTTTPYNNDFKSFKIPSNGTYLSKPLPSFFLNLIQPIEERYYGYWREK